MRLYGNGSVSNSRPLDLQSDSHLLPDTLQTKLRSPVFIVSEVRGQVTYKCRRMVSKSVAELSQNRSLNCLKKIVDELFCGISVAEYIEQSCSKINTEQILTNLEIECKDFNKKQTASLHYCLSSFNEYAMKTGQQPTTTYFNFRDCIK